MVREHFKEWCDRVIEGETVVVSRQKSKNVVIIAESEYNELLKAKQNTKYLEKSDHFIEQTKKKDELKVIKNNKFIEENGFVINAEGELIEYINYDQDLIIPYEVKGIKVTSIRPHAFAGCSSLKNIIIPDSVVSIDQEAFYDCKSLENIYIYNDTIEIAYQSFNLDRTTLYAHKGSATENYTKEYGYKFVPLP